MLWFSSCAKTEDNNDGIAPVISNIRFNSNDTINWEGTIIKINDSTSTSRELDTLVIGKILYMSGYFSTNNTKALSGYKVELWYKLINSDMEVLDDTLTAIGKNIYGMTEADIWNNRLIQIPDSVSRTEENEAGIDVSVIYKPIAGDYTVNVACGDIYGNKDSTLFSIRLLSRETIYNSRNK
jgi:hypothetical protein